MKEANLLNAKIVDRRRFTEDDSLDKSKSSLGTLEDKEGSSKNEDRLF